MPIKGSVSKKSLLASYDMERLGVNPIEMLKTIYDESLEAYRSGRGLTKMGDTGSAYLAVAGKAAADLASYKHPKLSAVQIKDVSNEDSTNDVINTERAIEIIKSDPFAISSAQVVETMKSTIQSPFLPSGIGDDKSKV